MPWLKVAAVAIAVAVIGVGAFALLQRFVGDDEPTFEDYLAKHDSARYRATYAFRHIYHQGGDFPAPGPYTVYKDGTRRARISIDESAFDGGESDLVQVIANADSAITCVEDFAKWATPRFGLSVDVDPAENVCFAVEGEWRFSDDLVQNASDVLGTNGTHFLGAIVGRRLALWQVRSLRAKAS